MSARGYFAELKEFFSEHVPPVTLLLITACVVMFLLQNFLRPLLPLEVWLGTSVAYTFQRGMVWQLLTYAFLHGSLMHLFFNALVFFFFAPMLELRLGRGPFVQFCAITAAGAALTHLLLSPLFGESAGLLIGFSGVLYATMMAVALYQPDDVAHIWGIVPIKLKHLVALLGIFSLALAVGDTGGRTAHLGHLGGFLFGFLCVKYPVLLRPLRFRNPLPRKKRGPVIVRHKDGWRSRDDV